MSFYRMVERAIASGLPTAMSAVAAMIAFIFIGYGIARPPEQGFASASQVIASQSLHVGRTGAQETAPSTLSPNASSAPSMPAANADDGPRECAPEQGVTDACIFN